MELLPEMLTLKDVMKWLHVTRATVIDLIQSGELIAINASSGKPGKYARYRFEKSALVEFLERKRTHAAAPSAPKRHGRRDAKNTNDEALRLGLISHDTWLKLEARRKGHAVDYATSENHTSN